MVGLTYYVCFVENSVYYENFPLLHLLAIHILPPSLFSMLPCLFQVSVHSVLVSVLSRELFRKVSTSFIPFFAKC